MRASLQAVLDVLEEQAASLARQIREHIDNHPDLKRRRDHVHTPVDLLQSIPGVGEVSAAVLLAELGDMAPLRSARQVHRRVDVVAAFMGLAPRLHESGTSVRARSWLCKMGRPRLRRAVYFPALSALGCNPAIQAMAQRLRAAGKSEMTVVGAAMRKLVHVAFGVLKSGKPFDPKIVQPNP